MELLDALAVIVLIFVFLAIQDIGKRLRLIEERLAKIDPEGEPFEEDIR